SYNSVVFITPQSFTRKNHSDSSISSIISAFGLLFFHFNICFLEKCSSSHITNFSTLQNVPLKLNPQISHCESILSKQRHISVGDFDLNKMSQDKCHPTAMDKKRLKPFCNWRTLAILLLLSFAFTCFTILLCKC
ncbi:unnamed protein product, partial [Brugia timori]|uniref:Ovule protein n=1 Tax=Brugia timori TaxID=42155 RepID=A0A0R3QPE7_9BILA